MSTEEVEVSIDIESAAPDEKDGESGQERRDNSNDNAYRRSIYSIPVDVLVTIGTARPTVAELLQMKRDSLIQLDSKIDDPVELYVDNKVIARGELIESDDGDGSIGVRLTEIVDTAEDML
ncbi:FliM/FliN family flagellar motor switch protein [Parvularcula sp. IMCC14364]|uniref:FliM/FliN family flagellar motor switch protein n=1 Tax=Parvularcula sp. IMCC14364 TaxID=3067902 RepID=UPI0027420901|nr:FliM/FliN family flagellar motor switch protein [Parvularcula sp. IMCC14364]